MTPRRNPGPLVVALVGCGKAKLAHAAPARELYTGALFRGSIEHAEATADRVFIASALHGLLLPDQVIEPYDARLPTGGGGTQFVRTREDATAGWRARVGEQLRAALGAELAREPNGLAVVIYAGADYAGPLRAAVQHALSGDVSVTVFEPLAGMQIGERLHWLKDARAARARGELRPDLSVWRAEVAARDAAPPPPELTDEVIDRALARVAAHTAPKHSPRGQQARAELGGQLRLFRGNPAPRRRAAPRAARAPRTKPAQVVRPADGGPVVQVTDAGGLVTPAVLASLTVQLADGRTVRYNRSTKALRDHRLTYRIDRIVWIPLRRDGKWNAEVRRLTRGKAGVYAIRERGGGRTTLYVGEGGKARSSEGAPKRLSPYKDRLYKTILRHFQEGFVPQAYATGERISDKRRKSHKRDGGRQSAQIAYAQLDRAERKGYRYGGREWTYHKGGDLDIALYLTPPSKAREVEGQLIAELAPTEQGEIGFTVDTADTSFEPDELDDSPF